MAGFIGNNHHPVCAVFQKIEEIIKMVFETTILIWLIPLIIWEAIWKGVGLWKSGKNNQLYWFIAMFILNTAGILPIIYLRFYQKKK